MDDVVPERTRIGGVGAVTVAVALTGVAGIPGALAAVAVLLAWAFVADIAAFAIVIVAVGGLLSADAFVASPEFVAGVEPLERLSTRVGVSAVDLLSLTVLAAATLPLSFGQLTTTGRPIVTPLLAVVLTAVLGTIAAIPILAGESVGLAAAVLVTTVCVVSYVLHRSGLVVAGVHIRG